MPQSCCRSESKRLVWNHCACSLLRSRSVVLYFASLPDLIGGHASEINVCGVFLPTTTLIDYGLKYHQWRFVDKCFLYRSGPVFFCKYALFSKIAVQKVVAQLRIGLNYLAKFLTLYLVYCEMTYDLTYDLWINFDTSACGVCVLLLLLLLFLK
jgi:hypothetical protein